MDWIHLVPDRIQWTPWCFCMVDA